MVNIACTHLSVSNNAWLDSNDTTANCQQFFDYIDKKIDIYEVRDAQTYKIQGIPYLRSNRFLASFRSKLTADQKIEWIAKLKNLATSSYKIEISNLPDSAHKIISTKLQSKNFYKNSIINTLNYCANYLSNELLTDEKLFATLLQSVSVPDNYNTWQRILGLYPLVALPVSFGINQWHNESTTKLQTPIDNIAAEGELRRYYSDNNFASEKLTHSVFTKNELGVPEFTTKQIDHLFQRFAPIWEIDTSTLADKIGKVEYRQVDERVYVNTDKPSIYTKLTFTRLNDAVLPQLNYFIWFPSRPCVGSIDILCGHLDGIIWRVTLSNQGQPILYDTIHQCGCYHTFFPTKTLTPKPPTDNLDETAFVPLLAPHITAAGKIVLRIESTTHHIVSLYIDKYIKSGIHLKTFDYDELRSISTTQGYKSLFNQNGLVKGTERSERWLLWPMGITSPGAMRQWGNHPTAFIGRRHFDDPCLIQNNFDIKTNSGQQLSHCPQNVH